MGCPIAKLSFVADCRALARDLGIVGTGEYLFGPVINIMGYDPALYFGQHPATLHNLANGPVGDLTVNVYDRSDDGTLRIDFNAKPALYRAEDNAAHHHRFLGLPGTLAGADPQQPNGRVGILTVFGDVELSYAPLNTRANRLAHQLIGLGVGPEQIVAADAPTSDTWQSLISGHIETHEIACTHTTMTQPAPLAHIGRVLAEHLDIISSRFPRRGR